MDEQNSKKYWNENLGLIRKCLFIWFFVPFGCGIGLAKPLNNLSIGRLPLSFWIVQQGALLVFIILSFVYAIKMDALDEKYQQTSDQMRRDG